MAEYRGYKCDECGNIVDKPDLTRMSVRYVGSLASGEFEKDLCPLCTKKCLDASPQLRPLRRRAASKEKVSA